MKSTDTENHCQYCLTPWKYGNLVIKTNPQHKKKNCILRTMKAAEKLSFIMVNVY